MDVTSLTRYDWTMVPIAELEIDLELISRPQTKNTNSRLNLKLKI